MNAAMHRPDEKQVVARRRGRPQRLPEDASPLTGHVVAADQRVAWLLATSRILGKNAQYAHQEAFAQALRGEGFTVDNSRISRWESGAKPLPIKVVSAYERLLGIPSSGLVAIAVGVYRSCGTPVPTPKRSAAEGLRSQQDLDDAFALVESRSATGSTWLRLAEDLGHFDRVYLNPATWRSLSLQLINELSRSVGSGYVRRNEACHRLLANPVARRHLVRAIGEVVTGKHAQMVQPALGLLSGLDDPAAGALILRLIESDHPLLHHAAANIAPAKLARGHFEAADLPRLEALVVRTMRNAKSSSAGLHALDLAATLPDSSFERVCRELRDTNRVDRLWIARTQGQLVPIETSRTVARTIAARAQEETGAPFATEPDTMLRRLISDALFHTHRERRLQAALLLGASAYAPAVAHGCIAAAEDSSEIVATRAYTVLQTVGLGQRRDAAVRFATNAKAPVHARVRALNAISVSSETLPYEEAAAIEALATGRQPTVLRQAALKAIGMNAHDRIPGLAGSEDAWVANNAAWWTEHGNALHDEDLRPRLPLVGPRIPEQRRG